VSDFSEPFSLLTVVTSLRSAGCVFAEEEAQLLFSAAETEVELSLMIDRRKSGIPLEQILGWAEFCGLRVAIETGVFIPRHRTEFLVSQAISLSRPNSVVLDLCCGSGAIGLAMISFLPHIKLYAADIDPVAVRCAHLNLAPFRGKVFESDLFESIPKELKGNIEILIANAPYVPTEAIEMLPRESRIYETRVSLDGGGDGLEVQRRIAATAPQWLTPKGFLLVETSEKQASNTAKIFMLNGLKSRIVSSDEFDATVVIGMKCK
jgi:release factor glutamine methyltransferase